MQDYRKVYAAYTGLTLEKGHGTSLRRILGPETVHETSSFLLLEVLTARNAVDLAGGFPWRAYKGIECITYFANTTGKLRDASSSNEVWLCAGNGEIREQIPPMSTPVVGMQLWAAIPPDAQPEEGVCPGFTDLPSVKTEAGGQVGVVAGLYDSVEGPITSPSSGVTFLDVYVPAHGSFTYGDFPSDRLIVYVMEGEGYFEADEDELFSENRALVMTEGKSLFVKATHRGLRFLILHAPSEGMPVLKLDEVKKAEDDWTALLEA